MKKLTPAFWTLSVMVAILGLFSFLASGQQNSGDQAVQHQIEKAKIYREAYPLISETDLYCSIYAYNGELPDLRITDAEKGAEKILLSDSDLVFVNKGKNDGLEIGQVFLIIEIGQSLGDHGYLAVKQGRAHIVFLEDRRSVARIEKACGRVMVGDYLIPFEEKESLLGKDLGYEAFSEEDKGAVGTIIYLQTDYNQIGSGSWGIIDIGESSGVQIGQQMTIYKQIREDLPRVGIGNLIVIDTQPDTATFKILSCSDSVRKGHQVQAK
ncbi:MAG: hypothetical protein ACUVV5_04620 [Candidatus Aminicenantales bacterium]